MNSDKHGPSRRAGRDQVFTAETAAAANSTEASRAGVPAFRALLGICLMVLSPSVSGDDS